MDWYEFLPFLLNFSLTASVVIVFVFFARLCLKKAPKIFSYCLWAVVLFRLLCPVSVSTPFSLLGVLPMPAQSGEAVSDIAYIPENIVHTRFLEINTPLPKLNEAVNAVLPQGNEQTVADPMEAPITFLTYLWGMGVIAMLIWGFASYFKLREKLRESLPLRENIRLAENISSPFVIGIFRPKIYLPVGLSEKEREYIILHEKHHIKRLDHIVKLLAYFALCIHWFNPFAWLAFMLACRDMEMSCDEAVIRKSREDIRADYCESLLSLATGRRYISPSPLAFGEGGTGGRIRNLSRWKKPAVWAAVCIALACSVLALCLAVNPAAKISPEKVVSVTYEGQSVSDEAAAELVALVNKSRAVRFFGDENGGGILSRAVRINGADGASYVVNYQYYSGFSFHPAHAEEDDYRTILTFYAPDGEIRGKWRLEQDFDAAFVEWFKGNDVMRFSTGPSGRSYKIKEVVYESPFLDFSLSEALPSVMYVSYDGSFYQKLEGENLALLGNFLEITLLKDNFDELFREDGWLSDISAKEIRNDTLRACRLISRDDVLYYLIVRGNGEVYLAQGYYDSSEAGDPYSDDTCIHRLFRLGTDVFDESLLTIMETDGQN